MPFFSIIIPTYNRAHLIKPAIESVINQSFPDWELIIIDDGSKDNTEEVVRSIPDNRVQYFYQENAERSAARNNGISKATGQYICFLDSDDVWHSNHLQIMYDKIKEENFKEGLFFTAMRWVFPDHRQDVIFESPVGKNQVEYVITNQIGTPTQCIHHNILKKHQYKPSLKMNEDVELCARIVSEYPLIQIPVITVDVFVHGENTKFLIKDYITPQIEVMGLIFNNPLLKDKISDKFKTATYKSLRSQLINIYYEQGRYAKMNKEILRYVFTYPTDKNKSRVVLFLYHMPGGSLIRKTVGFVKLVFNKKQN